MDTTLVLEAPPQEAQPIRMTYEEYLAQFGEDKQVEWVNGEVIVHMPPKIRHQDMVLFLASLLRWFVNFFNLGSVLSALTEMRLTPEGPSREPDILFVATENLGRLSETKLNGPADLVVEFISDESVTRDRADKFYEYQTAGVREYWLFDPRPGKERVDIWTLDETGRFQPVLPDAQGNYRSRVLPGFWLREEWLWASEAPNLQDVFAEIVGFPPEVRDAIRKFSKA